MYLCVCLQFLASFGCISMEVEAIFQHVHVDAPPECSLKLRQPQRTHQYGPKPAQHQNMITKLQFDSIVFLV